MPSPLFIRQIELGPYQNFVYLVGSRATREVVVVDPAWDVPAILRAAQEEDVRICAVMITHTHPDHINGVEELLTHVPVKVHVHESEASRLGVPASDLVKTRGGDTLALGDVTITFLHTPGHTPGSQCFYVTESLVAGDTLFVGGCGRCDLPGGDPARMFASLQNTLLRLDDRTILFPGHNYAPRPTSTIGDERRINPYLQFHDLRAFVHYRMEGYKKVGAFAHQITSG